MDCSAEEMWEKLRCHRVQIVQELRVDRCVLFDYLRSKDVFDAEDCQIVHAERTNEQRASKLLDILATKGTKGLQHFIDVLQLLNPGLYEKLTGQRVTPSLTSQCGVDILNIHLKEDQQLKARLEELITGSDVNGNFLQNLLVQAIIGELLSAVGEVKKLKSQVDEERAKNTKLLNEIKKLSQIFEEEQCKSTKLSETISLLQGNCKTVEHLTIRNRELEMERDQTVSELPQLKSWDEVLKAFYEIEEKSKQQYQERYESNTAEISALRERLIRVEEDLKCLKMGRKNSLNSSNLVNESDGHEWKEWLSRIPYEVLVAMACCPSDQGSVDDRISSSNISNFGIPPSSPAEYDHQWKQSQKEVIYGQWKKENETPDGCYVIDDSIKPQPRPRADALDRSRTSRYKFRALRRIP